MSVLRNAVQPVKMIQSELVRYKKLKNIVDVAVDHGASPKRTKLDKGNKDNKVILGKLKKTLATMADEHKTSRVGGREIILVFSALVWLITFIAIAVGFSSPHSTLRFVS